MQQGSKMGGKRKSPCHSQANQNSFSETFCWAGAAINCEAATTALAPRKAGKRFVGVRQRPSGRWVAEIKDTIQKIRVWLGTFDTAEAAARAYDEAACLLRGANTRTNFWPRPDLLPAASSALPPKIANHLLMLKARNSSASTATTTSNSFTANATAATFSLNSVPKLRQQPEQHYIGNELEGIDKFKFSDFLNSPSLCTTYATQSSDVDSYVREFVEENCSKQRTQNQGGRKNNDDGFYFAGGLEGLSSGLYSPFKIAEEIAVGSMENEADSMISFGAADDKRMKYERRMSASLYALNGVPECLRLRVGAGGIDDHLSDLMNSCKRNRQTGEMVGKECEHLQVDNKQSLSPLENSPSSSSPSSPPSTTTYSINDEEFSLWSSLDLSPICYVT